MNILIQEIRQLRYLWQRAKPCLDQHAPFPGETPEEYRVRSGCGIQESKRCVEWWKIERGQ